MKKIKMEIQYFSRKIVETINVNNPWNVPNNSALSWKYSHKQYGVSKKNTKVDVKHNGLKYHFGKLIENKETSSGMNYKIIVSPDKNTHTLMFAGTNFTSWKDDLSDLNYAYNGTSGQAEDAYNKIVEQFRSNKNNPNFHLFVTGHSLGGMNIQRAVAKFALNYPNEVNRINGTIFESPNIYDFLSPREKIAISGVRHNFKNYTKSSDIISSGFGLLPYQNKTNLVGESLCLKSDLFEISSNIFNVYINVVKKNPLIFWGLPFDINSLFKSILGITNGYLGIPDKILNEHMLDEVKKESNISFDKIENYHDFKDMFITQMDRLNSLSHLHNGMSGNDIKVNTDEIISVVSKLKKLIDDFEHGIEQLVSKNKLEMESKLKEIKNVYFETAPDLDYLEVEWKYNEDIVEYYKHLVSKYDDIKRVASNWRDEMDNVLSNLKGSAFEYEHMDNTQKNKFNLVRGMK